MGPPSARTRSHRCSRATGRRARLPETSADSACARTRRRREREGQSLRSSYVTNYCGIATLLVACESQQMPDSSDAGSSVFRLTTNVDDLIARLAEHRTLAGVPRAELEWLATRGDLYDMTPGNLLMASPEMLESLVVVRSGRFAIYVDHGAGPHKVLEWTSGDVSGLLPYSRMSRSIGDVVVDEEGSVFIVHARHFSEMIRECPTITTALVHVMNDRARHFRSSELQD